MRDRLVSSNRQKVEPLKPPQLTAGRLSRVTNSPASSNSANAMHRMAPSRRRSPTHLWPLPGAMVCFLARRQLVARVVRRRPLSSNHRISSWGRRRSSRHLLRWCRAMVMGRLPKARLGSMQPISLTLRFLVVCPHAMKIRLNSSRWQIWSFRKKSIRMRFAKSRLTWIEAILIALANISSSWTKTQMVTSRWTIHTLMETISKFSTVSETMNSKQKMASYCLNSNSSN